MSIYRPVGALNRFDAANYLSISTRTLDKLATEGDLERVKIGRKTIFRIGDLDELLQSKMENRKDDHVE